MLTSFLFLDNFESHSCSRTVPPSRLFNRPRMTPSRRCLERHGRLEKASWPSSQSRIRLRGTRGSLGIVEALRAERDDGKSVAMYRMKDIKCKGGG